MASEYDFVNRFSIKDEFAFAELLDAVTRLEYIYHDTGDFESDRRNKHNMKITMKTMNAIHYLPTAKIAPDVIRAVRNGIVLYDSNNRKIDYDKESLRGIYLLHDDYGNEYNKRYVDFADERQFFEVLSLLVADDDFIAINITDNINPINNRAVIIRPNEVKSYGVDYCIRHFAMQQTPRTNDIESVKVEIKKIKAQLNHLTEMIDLL